MERKQIEKLAEDTEYFSFRDLKLLIRDANNLRLEELTVKEIQFFTKLENLRPISYDKYEKAMEFARIDKLRSQELIRKYEKFEQLSINKISN